MPLKVFAAKYRWNPKEEEWILKNDKDDHYYNNSALKNAWSSLSYPIRDGDYYFAFIHDNPRINAQYNAQANRELQKYKKSFLNPEEIYDKMHDYFKRFKDAGSGDTMTREELWTAVVDMRKKNPAPKKPTNESNLQEVSLNNNMMQRNFANVWATKDAKIYRVLFQLVNQDGFVDNAKAYKRNPKDYLNRLRNIAKNPKKYEKSFGRNFAQYINNPKPGQAYAKLPESINEELQNEAVNYHTKISGTKIIDAMKKNKVLKKYVSQIPTKAMTTYDLVEILMRQMKKFGFDKKEVKAIEDVMQTAYSSGMKKESINEVTDKEINMAKKLSKDMEKVKKGYQQIAKTGDKTLKSIGFNPTYEAILKAQQKVLSLIGELNTMKMMSDRAASRKKDAQGRPIMSSNIMDSYRQMHEDNLIKLIDEGKMGQLLMDIQQGATAKELAKDYKIPLSVAKDFLKDYYMQKRNNRKAYESVILEKKEMNPKVIEKIAKLTDRNEHNDSLLLLAKELKDRDAIKLLNSIKDMHKVYNSMPRELLDLRNRIFDNLMRQSSSKYSNHKDVYGAM